MYEYVLKINCQLYLFFVVSAKQLSDINKFSKIRTTLVSFFSYSVKSTFFCNCVVLLHAILIIENQYDMGETFALAAVVVMTVTGLPS